LLGSLDAVKVYTEQNETYLKPLNDNRQIKPTRYTQHPMRAGLKHIKWTQ